MDAGEPGAIVAERYQLRAELGRGGMGVVWLACDELLDREVAVKEILWPNQLGAMERETLRQRALREARTAARLHHPNIVGVYDVVEDDGRPWIVMQYVPYRSLRDVVREDGPLSQERAARVGLTILAAIRAAHAAGVLHRDVKPGNILLGPEDQAVLTDFGMAIADGSPTLTTSGMLIGSPSYMAPERARGEPASAAADMWSLGATLYAAVEGRPPFDREGTMAVLAAVVSADPDPPSRAGALWPVISGLLRKDPDERLDTYEVESQLRRIAEAGSAVPGAAAGEATSPLTGPGLPATGPVPDGPAPDGPRSAPARPTAPTAPTWPQRQPPAAGDAGTEQHADPEPAVVPLPDPPPPPPLGGPLRGKRLRPRWLLAVVGCLAAVAAIVAAVELAPGSASGHQTAAPPSVAPSRLSRAHSAGRPSRRASTRPNTHTSASAAPTSGSDVLPAGFSWYHDPSGFSIGMPTGWQVSHQGHLVYIQDPDSDRFLIVDQTTHPQPNALEDWRQQEAARMSTYPGYHRIRLVAVKYAQAEQAADWQFTYYLNGQLTEVLNFNILVNSHQAYALYWSTPESEWNASYHYFLSFAATFHPVNTNVGS